MFKIRNLIVVGGIAAGIVGGAVAPAMAATNPVQVTATIGSTISMSGQTNIDFGNVPAGVTTTMTGVESYSVSSNAPYNLSIVPANNGMRDLPSSDSLPNASLAVKETGENAGVNYMSFPGGTAPLPITTNHVGGSNFSYTENWQITPPGSQAPGSYSEIFTYTADAS